MGLYCYSKSSALPPEPRKFTINPSGLVTFGDNKSAGIVVPVKRHGRLIDADALYVLVKRRTQNRSGGWDNTTPCLTGQDVLSAMTILEEDKT